jgi:hypothetical protein
MLPAYSLNLIGVRHRRSPRPDVEHEKRLPADLQRPEHRQDRRDPDPAGDQQHVRQVPCQPERPDRPGRLHLGAVAEVIVNIGRSTGSVLALDGDPPERFRLGGEAELADHGVVPQERGARPAEPQLEVAAGLGHRQRLAVEGADLQLNDSFGQVVAFDHDSIQVPILHAYLPGSGRPVRGSASRGAVSVSRVARRG